MNYKNENNHCSYIIKEMEEKYLLYKVRFFYSKKPLYRKLVDVFLGKDNGPIIVLCTEPELIDLVDNNEKQKYTLCGNREIIAEYLIPYETNQFYKEATFQMLKEKIANMFLNLYENNYIYNDF